MIQKKRAHGPNPKNMTEFKDDDLAPKGSPKHVIEPDWPTKEAAPLPKKRKIKRTENARLP